MTNSYRGKCDWLYFNHDSDISRLPKFEGLRFALFCIDQVSGPWLADPAISGQITNIRGFISSGGKSAWDRSNQEWFTNKIGSMVGAGSLSIGSSINWLNLAIRSYVDDGRKGEHQLNSQLTPMAADQFYMLIIQCMERSLHSVDDPYEKLRVFKERDALLRDLLDIDSVLENALVEFKG